MTILPAALLAFAGPGTYQAAPLTPDLDEPAAFESDCIPVLCYHGIGGSGALSVSPERLRSDLEILYEAGFHLALPSDLFTGFTRVPSDRIPVILTFDDGWESQFELVEGRDGLETTAGCAVGILEAFCEAHPDFGRGAAFFISWDKIPFGQADLIDEKLNFLLDNGYEIGNHSLRHASFMRIPTDEWERHLAGAVAKMKPYIGLRTSLVTSVSWPGGRFPEGARFDEILESMTFQGSPVASCGFLVDGSLLDLSECTGADGRYRMGRFDMARCSIYSVIRSRRIVDREPRTGLHDPLPWRARALPPLRIR